MAESHGIPDPSLPPSSEPFEMFEVPPDPCTETGKKVKKHAASRAAIWLHYTRVPDEPDRASCNYCGTTLGVNSSRNGTSSLNNHAKICKKYAIVKSGSRANQTELRFQLMCPPSLKRERGSLYH